MKRHTEHPRAFWTTAAVGLLVLAYGVHRTIQPDEGQGQDQGISNAQPMQAAASAPLLSVITHASSENVGDKSGNPCQLAVGTSPFGGAPTTPAASPASKKVELVDKCVDTTESASLSQLLEAELANGPNQGLVSWSNLTPAAENTSIDSATINASQSTDGILLNIDRPIEGLGKTIQAALEAGQIVVLDTSGGEANRQNIQELSLEYGNVGVLADAVMLYKGAADAEVSVMPYDAEEKKELASLMSIVGRRQASETTNQ